MTRAKNARQPPVWPDRGATGSRQGGCLNSGIQTGPPVAPLSHPLSELRESDSPPCRAPVAPLSDSGNFQNNVLNLPHSRGDWRQLDASQGRQHVLMYCCVSLYVLPTLVCLGVHWDVPSPLAYSLLHSGKGVGDSSME